MPNPGQELATIDFASMLGGPLIAAVNAQAQAAMSAVNFIKEVGFKKIKDDQDPTASETGDPVYVVFKYPKELSPYQPAVAQVGDPAHPAGLPPFAAGPPVVGDAAFPAGLPPFVAAKDAVKAVFETQQLEVPILTMLPIPYIRIDDVTIDFNAKINSVEYQKIDTSLKVDAALEVKANWLWGSAKLNVSVSYQRSTQQGSTVNRTYSMAVHIKAVQDEMPGGMEKILGILEDAIRSQPAKV
ncbi:MAG: DUF2589 domain-containing protein [Ignavibacteriae bacterium]|nr:DUF2589 domain-containing protein [Ignavibacteria bacterium]MBI3364349.1 DUF2589 domain-containing protein [Ignavibacteriota bacterium]